MVLGRPGDEAQEGAAILDHAQGARAEEGFIHLDPAGGGVCDQLLKPRLGAGGEDRGRAGKAVVDEGHRIAMLGEKVRGLGMRRVAAIAGAEPARMHPGDEVGGPFPRLGQVEVREKFPGATAGRVGGVGECNRLYHAGANLGRLGCGPLIARGAPDHNAGRRAPLTAAPAPAR